MMRQMVGRALLCTENSVRILRTVDPFSFFPLERSNWVLTPGYGACSVPTTNYWTLMEMPEVARLPSSVGSLPIERHERDY